MDHGPIAPDGSPAEFYLQLPPAEEEPAIMASVAPRAGGSVLELGCGVGRVTHPFVAGPGGAGSRRRGGHLPRWG